MTDKQKLYDAARRTALYGTRDPRTGKKVFTDEYSCLAIPHTSMAPNLTRLRDRYVDIMGLSLYTSGFHSDRSEFTCAQRQLARSLALLLYREMI